jgi:hypothetical protein
MTCNDGHDHAEIRFQFGKWYRIIKPSILTIGNTPNSIDGSQVKWTRDLDNAVGGVHQCHTIFYGGKHAYLSGMKKPALGIHIDWVKGPYDSQEQAEMSKKIKIHPKARMANAAAKATVTDLNQIDQAVKSLKVARHLFTGWEIGFVESLDKNYRVYQLSAKQRSCLKKILKKWNVWNVPVKVLPEGLQPFVSKKSGKYGKGVAVGKIRKQEVQDAWTTQHHGHHTGGLTIASLIDETWPTKSPHLDHPRAEVHTHLFGPKPDFLLDHQGGERLIPDPIPDVVGGVSQNPCGEFINTTNFTANGASVEILIRCKCGIKYKIESRNAGKKGKCGACHATFMIPTLSKAEDKSLDRNLKQIKDNERLFKRTRTLKERIWDLNREYNQKIGEVEADRNLRDQKRQIRRSREQPTVEMPVRKTKVRWGWALAGILAITGVIGGAWYTGVTPSSVQQTVVEQYNSLLGQ